MAYGQAGTSISGSPPACLLYNSTAQSSIAASTHTAMAMDTERFKNQTGLHSTSSLTSRITIVDPGVYLFEGAVEWGSNATSTGVRQLELRLNGSNSNLIAVQQTQQPVSTGTPQSISAIWKMIAGDYMELCVFHTNSVAMTINASSAANGYSCHFGATWTGLGT